ncbi:hypothetical protein PALU110988_03705 [Paenibacillus lupini]|uniref:hypothetical protein n=1 Tax=Paenibacillus lupini TaxID=1450204 RepID=UPI00141DAF7B|nr:hypothetical protein [Paenibacillus lupini]NIK21215.1 hypothetical protein [Paenibacillus lupini]
MSSVLELKRTSQYANKLRTYKVYLNGVIHEKIADGQTMRYELEPGNYELYLSIDWCGSNRYSFCIQENETIQLKCGGVNSLLTLYYIIFDRNNYLYIK